MLSHTIREVFIAQHVVDFRKGVSALYAEALALELDPYRGECLIFIHRSHRKLRVLGGDSFGLWLLERRFDGGKLELKFEFMKDPAICTITAPELAMILDGNAFVIEKRAKKWRQ